MKKHLFPVLGMIAGLVALSAELSAAENVDFGYSPPEWQTAICLPDDSQKTLVDKSGELLYHYNQGGREFGTRVSVQVAGDALWQKQGLASPRVPIVKTCRSAEGLNILEEAFAVADLPPAVRRIGSGRRGDILLVHVTNTSKQARTVQPKLIVDTKLGARLDGQRVVINGRDAVTCSLKMTGMERDQQVCLEPLAVPAGKTVDFCVFYSGSGGQRDGEPPTVSRALALRGRMVAYWEKGAALPFGRIEVPDAGIQALVDSSIRNIWQAREIKKGLPAFQVGPTCYRGLWIVDGAFLLEAATLLGAGQDARAGVEYELSHQKPSGAFEVLSPQYYKENGIVLWTCVRHAILTQDKPWLRSVWPKLQQAVAYIETLRTKSRENPDWLCQGLIPPGIIDGGLWRSEKGEYSNVYWNLLGLRSAIGAARWIGRDDDAAQWQKQYDEFYATFRHAAQRDMQIDAHGHRYLPTIMGNLGNQLPQRAQWSFCQAVYPGQIFGRDDPLVAGNLAMLEATEREGMVYGTGWDATGIWNYFASFYGHAWLWQGQGQKAARVLYAFANHAAPVLDWREEQSLKGEKYKKVGDMPHNWASAEFIRLTVHLLALDRGDELHLLEGLPAQWARPGMATRLTGIATPFGKLAMELKVAADGKSARLTVEPLSDASCKKTIVHLGGWASADQNAVIELDPQRAGDQQIPLAGGETTAHP